MLIFKSFDTTAMLGVTPLSRAQVSDSMVWEHLLTPTVKAMLGPLKELGEPRLFETTAGHFPGDEATNLNAHKIYGQEGFVRYPYISVCHRTTYGALVIKRDFRKIKVSAWVGDVDEGKAECIFLVALRDRRYDGTKAANDCAFLTFPYEHVCNKPLAADLNSLEISIYSFLPGSRIKDACGDLELDQFVEKPFTFRDRHELFLKLFNKAWASKRGPGQHAAPIKDTAKVLLPGIETVAKHCGYDLLEAAASHYHVAMWFMSSGFRVSYQHDVNTMRAIAAGLKRIRDKGTPLTRPQQSWVCVLQSLSDEQICPHLQLGIKWPQDNIAPDSLWLCKPLSAKGSKLLLPITK